MEQVPTTGLRKTPLYESHLAAGAKMAGFANFSMPIVFTKSKTPSITESHEHLRKNAGVFDVSHMLQVTFHGADAKRFMERVTVGNFHVLRPTELRYSLLMNEHGGIVDDMMVARGIEGDPKLYVVVNAGCQDKDVKHFTTHLREARKEGMEVDMEILHDVALLALQGPKAASVLAQHVTEDLTKMRFMTRRYMFIDGVKCSVARSGYTGEDGFEIGVPARYCEMIYNALLAHSEVEPAGLGARDSLRLEAGLCLYGHDLEEDITPIEGDLAWTIDRVRRKHGGFLGDDIVLKQLKDGTRKVRVGIFPEVIAREGAALLNEQGDTIGHITSGLLSPTLQRPIAMGYVDRQYSKLGTSLKVMVRGKVRKAVVAKMPFVPHHYYRLPTKNK